MRRTSKTVLNILITIVILLVGTFFVIRYLVVKSLPNYNEETEISGLKNNVEVYFDDFAVPHIYAENDDDLIFLQGFLHAQDRLWQMDLIRRAGEGRLSEILGKATIDFDRQIRVLEIKQIAKKIENTLSDEDKKLLQSYANGVNTFIKSHKGKLPLEFDMLNYSPENWEPFHTLMISRLMAFELNISWYVDVTLGEIINKVGFEKAKEIFPTYPDNAPVTIPIATNILSDEFQKSISVLNELVKIDIDRRKFLGTSGMHIGSNSFAVSSKKSSTGFALLASDPHLALASPAKWYEVHLVSPEINLHGMSLPGVPLVVIGNNTSIAWGLTNVMLDDSDFYIEEVEKSNPNNYIVDGKSHPFTNIVDSIFVKDSGFVILNYRTSKHGPIVNDINPILKKINSPPIAMKWSASDLTAEIKTFKLLAKANNWNDFRNAVKNFGVPAQNFIYADKFGNIGFQFGGNIPIRSQNNPTIPMNGNNSQNDWKGYVPFNELPSIYNPEQNFIANANNKTTNKNFPYHISNLWEPPSRIQRITEMLSVENNISPEDLKKIQNDNFSFFAKNLTSHILETYKNQPVDGNLEIVLNYLKNWNYIVLSSEVAPSIYAVFFNMIIKNTLHDEIGDNLLNGFQHLSNIPYRVILNLLEKENSVWFDDIKTENVETKSEIIKKSLDETILFLTNKLGSDIKNWKWGKLHSITFKHPIGSQPPFGILFNIGPFEMNGDGVTVNNAEYSLNRPYEMILGPSMRRVVDFGNLDNLQTVITTGQSGQPLSEHYKDQALFWVNGNYKTTSMSKSKIEKEAKYKNVYNSEKK
ncbi:MAG: penicillin acylase family protein [Bacteroidetes bacterium]|nr:penicillin acylase family protein [Bacteroidota bacterium]